MSLQKAAASEKKYKLCVETCIYSASVFLFCFAVHNTYAKNIDFLDTVYVYKKIGDTLNT